MKESDAPVMAFFKRLLSRGLSQEVALEEAVTFEATLRSATIVSSPAEIVRHKERTRKAEQRSRKTKNVPDNGSAAISSSGINSDDSVLEKEDAATSDVPDKSSRSKGSRIPDDWEPSVEDCAYGERLKLTDPEIAGCGEEMKMWAQANANRAVARKADWGLTFKGWMRRAAPQIIRNRPRGGGPNGQAQGAAAGKAGFSSIAGDLRRKLEGGLDDRRPAPEDLRPVNGR